MRRLSMYCQRQNNEHPSSLLRNPENASNEFFLGFKSALKRIYNRCLKNNPSSDFLCACGLNCQVIEMENFYYGKQFWQQGTIQESSLQTHCNLFAYSEGSGNHFAVHEYISPYQGFHLGTGISKLTRESPFYQVNDSQSIGGWPSQLWRNDVGHGNIKAHASIRVSSFRKKQNRYPNNLRVAIPPRRKAFSQNG